MILSLKKRITVKKRAFLHAHTLIGKWNRFYAIFSRSGLRFCSQFAERHLLDSAIVRRLVCPIVRSLDFPLVLALFGSLVRSLEFLAQNYDELSSNEKTNQDSPRICSSFCRCLSLCLSPFAKARVFSFFSKF